MMLVTSHIKLCSVLDNNWTGLIIVKSCSILILFSRSSCPNKLLQPSSFRFLLTELEWGWYQEWGAGIRVSNGQDQEDCPERVSRLYQISAALLNLKEGLVISSDGETVPHNIEQNAGHEGLIWSDFIWNVTCDQSSQCSQHQPGPG